MTKIKE